EITPQFPVDLAGYGFRTEKLEGVIHPLYLRVALFKQVDSTNQVKGSLVVSADFIWWSNERMDELRRKLATITAIPLQPEQIVLSATHTHSGPQTSSLTPFIGKVDLQYVEWMEAQLFTALRRAEENMEPVIVEKGVGTCDIGIHRRVLVDGKIT